MNVVERAMTSLVGELDANGAGCRVGAPFSKWVSNFFIGFAEGDLHSAAKVVAN